MFLFVVRTVGNERSHDDKNKKPDTVVFLHVAQKALMLPREMKDPSSGSLKRKKPDLFNASLL